LTLLTLTGASPFSAEIFSHQTDLLLGIAQVMHNSSNRRAKTQAAIDFDEFMEALSTTSSCISSRYPQGDRAF
jgi:hypothetical protein